MALITSQQPIRYCIDKLSSSASGVISSLDTYPVDLTRAQKVIGITVGGTQPAGTKRFIAFKISGVWGKLTSSGTFSAFTQNSCTFETLSESGNIPADLTALTDIPALAGKSFGVAVGLSSENPDNVLPTCSLSFKCQNSSQQLTAAKYSPTYRLPEDAQLISLTADTDSYSGGSVEIFGQAVLPDGSSTGWVKLENLSGVKASSVQFRADCKAQTPGVSGARVNSVKFLYSTGSTQVTDADSGGGAGELITLTQDWYLPIKNCRLTVRHAPLEQSELKAYAAFRASPVHEKSEHLGVGSGSRKTFQLTHTQGIKYDSFKLFYDARQIFSDYELNCEAGRVTCTAPEGVIVSCSYDWNWGREDWHEMTLSSRLSYEDYDSSEFRYTDANNSQSVTALRITMSTTGGHITEEVLGAASGSAKSFRLSRRVKEGRITVTSDWETLSAKNWTLSDDGRFLTAAAPAGRIIRANYDWLSETPKVYQFAAVYSE